MRLKPLLKYAVQKSLNSQARFKKNESTLSIYTRPKNHQYTGNAATDLAWASMFDSQIAKDLKIMGLI